MQYPNLSKQSTTTYYNSNQEQAPLVPAPEERRFEAKVFATAALEILLKSMRCLCAGTFRCGKNFSGLPEDNVTAASVSTLTAILTSL